MVEWQKVNSLFEDIQGQPESLRGVIEHHLGAGRDTLVRAAAELRHARRVIFTGMGSSLFASMPAVSMLNTRGRPCSNIEASELLYFYSAALSADTAAVLISRSGNTVEVVKLIPELRARGVRIIGVTNVPDSKLARLSDIVVNVGSAPDQLVALRTYTGTTATLLELASQVLGTPAELLYFPDAMQSMIDETVEASVGWRGWLEPARYLYVLGRGPSLGSVNEGALLFHEAARTAAIPMSAAHFRHGPVEVVSPDFRAIVFATQKETRDLDLRLAQDLHALGGTVRVIGGGPELAVSSWPSSLPSNPLATILEIIPVQIAAARLAEWRGIPPADFQFAPMVTVEETGFANPAKRR